MSDELDDLLGDDGPRMANMLDALDVYIARYVAFPLPEARYAVVLWVAHCHAVDAFSSTPRLAVLSPKKGSGKTRLLEVVALVVPSPVHAVNMSPAALLRMVTDRHPTLLLDEADTYLGANSAAHHEDLRGLINAGHRRGAKAYRAEVSGKTVGIAEFPAFAPAALAGIGDLPDTVLDRSVIVAMKRRAPHEHVSPFRERVARGEVGDLANRLTRWGIGATERLADAWPDMPDGIADRAADVWEPLLAVADLAGGDWPDRARRAAVALNAARAARDPSLGIQLLSDCRDVMAGADRITTEDLIGKLVALEDRPWGDLRGNPIDARGIARRVGKYGVKPKKIRVGTETAKGYTAEDFYDAWVRYLPPASSDVPDVPLVPHPRTGRETDGASTGMFPQPLDPSLVPDPPVRPSLPAERAPAEPIGEDGPSLSVPTDGEQGEQGEQEAADDLLVRLEAELGARRLDP